MSGLVGSKCLSSIFVLGYWMNVSRALGGYGCREPVGEVVVDVPCGPSHGGGLIIGYVAISVLCMP